MARALRVRNAVFGSNTYLCPTQTPGGCVLVDPGLDDTSIDLALAESGLTPAAIVCTHGHFDHVGSASIYQERFGLPVYLPRMDVQTANRSNFLMMAFKLSNRITLPRFELVDDGFALPIGGDLLSYRATPGHTPGSSVVTFRGEAFTGDTLYTDGVGLVSLPGEDEEMLKRSILSLWDALGDEVAIRPGHGGSSPLGELKRNNRALRTFLGLEP